MPENPNPQGKGLVPVLEHWQSIRPGAVAAKDAGTLLNDYVVSLLILSAQFRFKPVVGNNYYLYRSGGVWRLSLIAPWEWADPGPGVYVGACRLRPDMTWEMNPAADIDSHPELLADLAAFVRAFVAELDSRDTLEAGLPFYVAGLPFYQRLLATGLAVSVKRTAQISGLSGRGTNFWLRDFTLDDGSVFTLSTK